jgi:hypothetical protein
MAAAKRPTPGRRCHLDRTVEAAYTASALRHAQVAQLVEHATENRSVGGSTPPLGTILFNDLAPSGVYVAKAVV